MPVLSITAAWNEAEAFVRREARLLFPIAFMLIALPTAVLQLATPPADPGQLPRPGLWLLFLALATVTSAIGSLALTYLALQPGASVAEALQRGARRFIVLVAAGVLVIGAAFLALVPLMVVLGAVGMAASGAGPSAGLTALIFAIAVAVALVLSARLLLITAVAAAEDVGPIAILRRSWDLTRPHFWKLLRFVLLILIVFLILSIVVFLVAGMAILAIAGPPQPGSLGAFLAALAAAALNMVFAVYVAALHARIYRQLTGGGRGDVFA